MSKKLWIGSLLVASAVVSNFALAMPRPILACRQNQGSNPIAVDVAVFEGQGGRTQVVATLHDSNDVLGEYRVTSKASPAVGGPLVYKDSATKGRNFRLTVNVDGTPQANGRRAAHVVARTKGGAKISKDVSCIFTR